MDSLRTNKIDTISSKEVDHHQRQLKNIGDATQASDAVTLRQLEARLSSQAVQLPGNNKTTIQYTISGSNYWQTISSYLLPVSASFIIINGFSSTDLSILAGSFVSSNSFNSITAATNASVAGFKAVAGSYMSIYSSRTGSGSFLDMAFFTSATEAMRINTSGNVTIGNGFTASGMLHVRRDQNGITEVLVQNATAGASSQAHFRATNDGNVICQAGMYSSTTTAYGAILANSAHLYSNSAAGLVIMNDTGPIKFASGGIAEVARFDTGARFLVGLTADNGSHALIQNAGNYDSTGSMRLDLSLLTRLASTDLSSYGIASGGAIVAGITATTNASICSIGVNAGNYAALSAGRTGASGTLLPLAFFTNLTEAMRIDTAGRLLINRTADSGIGFKLQISDSIQVDSHVLNSIASTDLSSYGIASGGAIVAGLTATTNASLLSLGCVAGSYAAVSASRTGSGTLLPLAFFTNLAEAARITTGGLLYVARTTDDGSSAKIQAGGDISASGKYWCAGSQGLTTAGSIALTHITVVGGIVTATA